VLLEKVRNASNLYTTWVKRAIVHPMYEKAWEKNDIAILEMEDEIKITGIQHDYAKINML